LLLTGGLDAYIYGFFGTGEIFKRPTTFNQLTEIESYLILANKIAIDRVGLKHTKFALLVRAGLLQGGEVKGEKRRI